MLIIHHAEILAFVRVLRSAFCHQARFLLAGGVEIGEPAKWRVTGAIHQINMQNNPAKSTYGWRHSMLHAYCGRRVVIRSPPPEPRRPLLPINLCDPHLGRTFSNISTM